MGLSDCTVEALLAVSDLNRARRFYEHQLGLGPGDEEDQAVRYPCAHGTRIFIYLSPGTPARHRRRWRAGSSTTSINDGRAGSRGVVFEQYNQPGLETDEGGVFDAGRFRAAWIKDPDGNTMALTEVSD